MIEFEHIRLWFAARLGADPKCFKPTRISNHELQVQADYEAKWDKECPMRCFICNAPYRGEHQINVHVERWMAT